MANVVPLTPSYPVIARLQTGEPLEEAELERVAGAINWSIAHIGFGVVVDQGYHEDEARLASPSARWATWRVPVSPLADHLRIEVEVEAWGTEPSLTFTGSVDSVVIVPTVGRGFAWGVLDVSGVGPYETIELTIDPDDDDLTLFAVQMRFEPLASPLVAAEHDGAIPMGLQGGLLTAGGQPLSAAWGHLVIQSLGALLQRPRVLLAQAGPWGGWIRSHGHHELLARAVVHVWPGAELAGAEYELHVLVKRHSTATTWMRLLADQQVVAEIEVEPDAAEPLDWLGAVFQLPSDVYHLVDDPKPTVALGYRFHDYSVVGAPQPTDTNAKVYAIAVWGP